MFFMVIAGTYSFFVGLIAYFVYQLKLLSVMLDKQSNIVENRAFLDDFWLLMKINAVLEKVWPKVREVKLEGGSHAVYRVATAIFVLILILQYFFPAFVLAAAPIFFVALAISAMIGNALQEPKKNKEIAKLILLPFSIVFPVFIAYQIDTYDKAAFLKTVLSSQEVKYETVLLGLTLGLAIFCYFGMRFVERCQKLVVMWVLNRALILAKRMVLVGITPKMPEEADMRAIAKEALVATVQNMLVFGAFVGSIVAGIKFMLGSS